MLLARPFAQRRLTLLALAGALMLGAFIAMPQGQAFASALLLLFRGQTLQPITTDYAHLQNAYRTLEELEKLGTLQGTVPSKLGNASSISAAASTAKFTPAQPGSLPPGFARGPSEIKVLGPSTVTLTLNATTANAYFTSIGSSQRLPMDLDGEQIIVNFPGVTVMKYDGSGARLYVGQAGQLTVQVSGNAHIDQVRDYLLTLPGLSSDTVTALKNITSWQTTIPLGIPTDRAGWTATSVGGTYGGGGVVLNDNTGVGSAVLWQRTDGSQSLGVGGMGLKASDVQSVASSLH